MGSRIGEVFPSLEGGESAASAGGEGKPTHKEFEGAGVEAEGVSARPEGGQKMEMGAQPAAIKGRIEYPYPMQTLRQWVVGDVLKERGPKTLIDVDERASIQEVAELMHRHNIACMPAYRLHLPDGSKEYFALITVMDILAFVMVHPAVEKLGKEPLIADRGERRLFREETLREVNVMLQTPIRDLQGLSSESTHLTLFTTTTPLLTLLDTFRRGKHHALIVPSDASRFKHPPIMTTTNTVLIKPSSSQK
ncbi:hypothetical protein HK102_011491, partial [Quaeritorhiza haematococci]